MTRRDIWLARALGAAADLVQWIVVPLFFGGALEAPTLVLDAVMVVVMTRLCVPAPARFAGSRGCRAHRIRRPSRRPVSASQHGKQHTLNYGPTAQARS